MPEHVPHEATLTSVPQLLTTPERLPQFLLSRAQSADADSAVQVHTFEAEQAFGETHEPQLAVRLAPQLSFAVTLPQL